MRTKLGTTVLLQTYEDSSNGIWQNADTYAAVADYVNTIRKSRQPLISPQEASHISPEDLRQVRVVMALSNYIFNASNIKRPSHRNFMVSNTQSLSGLFLSHTALSCTSEFLVHLVIFLLYQALTLRESRKFSNASF